MQLAKNISSRDRRRIREVITNWPTLKGRPSKLWETHDKRGGPSIEPSATDDQLSTGWVRVERDLQDQVDEGHCDMPPAAGAVSAASAPAELRPRGSDNFDQNIEGGNDGYIPLEQQQSEPLEPSRLPTDTSGSSTANQNIAPVLHLLQHTHQDVMQRTLNMNGVRAPLTTSLTNFMQSLDKFMLGLTEFVGTTSLSDDLHKDFKQLAETDFKHIRDDQFEAFRTADDQYGEDENALVQALWRSTRYLDKLLDAHKNELNDDILLRTLSSSQGHDDDPLEDTRHSPELLRFLSQTGDVDALREKLVDLNFEHEQILSDKETREQFGLSLDEDSLAFLESFDLQNETLRNELHAAETVLNSLRQYLSHEDINNISAEDASQLQVGREITPQEYTAPLESTSQQDLGPHYRDPIFPPWQTEPIQISKYLDETRPTLPGTTPIDPTDFINGWLLNELQSSPKRWGVFSSVLETLPMPELSAQQLYDHIRANWTSDIPVAELAQRRRFADQQSMEQHSADSQHLYRRSAIVVIHSPISLPLLKLDSNITANTLVEHARQTKEHYSSQIDLLRQ